MDAGDQTLLVGHALEHRRKLHAFVFVERFEQHGLMASGRSA
jgi:hypothetical protein